ncbi:MAG: peptidoglycan DD-metalloendopeptidase family protein [Selenomonas sp.]|jgi:murein DD-endopeptidase MepM/ murein hydrolase activator NlpD|nr:peptidoglycan DD-metalloendopeptidase family protein [Selenomonas sp.]MCI7330117.1 peptidoglycan DD-metalloendopeptidase family protein [Selenomonadaceae bacterium]MDD7056842.1 peptidoglycan DD-metalloendopeptidase family protein [Selenomonadaceae bacterium]MDY3916064.1 peptidoglycan DD-metalloendopeptidase family protein [Selenomonadaceae bacterium]
MQQFLGKKLVAAVLAALLFGSSSITVWADSLDDQKADYENRAAEKQKKSNEIQRRIATISEEKRALDEQADAAINDHKEAKAALDETLARMADNEAKLSVAQGEYEVKSKRLGKRVRDIYINGQISYLDVLFGAKDFSDFLTRMDLLKRVIKQDYDLVQTVFQEKKDIEQAQKELAEDKDKQAEQELKARKAREIMEQKVKKRQDLIDKMKSDKAVFDREYDELMAASKEVERMIRNSHADVPVTGSGAMIWPISGPVTSEFGWRTHPITGDQRFHSGLDIGGDYGMPIHAAQSGTVTYAGWISGYGNAVIIDHGGGVTTLYGHNQSLAVSVGQSVSQGETIAYCGSTGNSTGPHCHFEVRANGEPVSPYSYL